MDSAAWKRLVKPLLDDDWLLKDRFAHLRPVSWVVHGVLWEASASEPGFYLWRWHMPLYQPATVVDLSWSDRHGGGSRIFNVADESTRAAVAEAMTLVRAEAAETEVVIDPPGGVDSVGTMEVRAYGLLLEGNHGGATEVLKRVLRHEAKYAWQEEMLQRAEFMLSTIERGCHGEALQQLTVWRTACLAALKIDAE